MESTYSEVIPVYDENEQQDSRCLTEDEGKRYGYVYDINSQRILSKSYEITERNK